MYIDVEVMSERYTTRAICFPSSDYPSTHTHSAWRFGYNYLHAYINPRSIINDCQMCQEKKSNDNKATFYLSLIARVLLIGINIKAVIKCVISIHLTSNLIHVTGPIRLAYLILSAHIYTC